MLAFLWWMIIGLVAGAFARLLMPGRQPMGMVVTMLLGMAGSLVGGFISSMLFGGSPTAPDVQTSGLIMSTIGALVLLAMYGAAGRSRISA